MAAVLLAPEIPVPQELEFRGFEHEPLTSFPVNSNVYGHFVSLLDRHLTAVRECRDSASDRRDGGAPSAAYTTVGVKRPRQSLQDSMEPPNEPPDDYGDRASSYGWQNPETNRRRLACPFYQHDIEVRRTASSCSRVGFLTFQELRQHLRRTHRVSLCELCSAACSSRAELHRHTTEGLHCWDGTTSRVSSVERWQILYRTLFPGDPIPSPCKLCN
jgi:hypothetical protein